MWRVSKKRDLSNPGPRRARAPPLSIVVVAGPTGRGEQRRWDVFLRWVVGREDESDVVVVGNSRRTVTHRLVKDTQ
jgi:hypothetical protein